MFFLLSGEGPTDLGVPATAENSARGAKFSPGPLAMLVDQLVESAHGYSPHESNVMGFVSKSGLTVRASSLKAQKKSVRLPGKKREKETRYFYNNARLLAKIALDRTAQLRDDVVAILFRDADGTASSDRGEWAAKHKSMLDGFADEQFFNGVPMVAKPKSEAWLLCALKSKYRDCDRLEDRSGNDNSKDSLKAELAEHLGKVVNREVLCNLVKSKSIDPDHIQMPSFVAFRKHFLEVINS